MIATPSRALPLLALTAFACTAREPAPPPAKPRALEARLSGCLSVRPGRICERAHGAPLRILVAAGTSGPLAFSTDTSTLSATSTTTAGGGRRYELHPPDSATQLIARAPGAEWHIALMPAQRIPTVDESARLLEQGDSAAADRLLQESAAALPAGTRARVLRERARIARAKADPAAAQLYLEAMHLLESEQRFCEAADYALAAAFAATRLGRRFELARTALEAHRTNAARAEACEDPPARAPYYAGSLAFETGDPANAAPAFAEAEARTAELGLAADAEYARQGRALALEQLGRWSEASQLLAARPDDAARPACDRALAMVNRGWVALATLEAREGNDAGEAAPVPQPKPIFLAALALYGPDGCKNPRAEAILHINLALASLHEGDAAGAKSWIARARKTLPAIDAALELWIADVEGRIALAAGHAHDAGAIYARLDALARASFSAEARWRAALGRGASLEALGHADAAIRAYADAESLLGAESLLIPLLQGRETFLGGRERGARNLVDLLVRAGRDADALRAARTARVRALAALAETSKLSSLGAEERARWEAAIAEYRNKRDALDLAVAERWKLSKPMLAAWQAEHEALAQEMDRALARALEVLSSAGARNKPELLDPPEGELLLAYFPGRTSWIGFAAEGSQVRAQRLAPIAREAPARALLEPFDRALRRARRVRLMPEGALAAFDLHVLPWNGRPLVASLAVAYAVDRPGSAEQSPHGGSTRALIVGDPRGDLVEARAETASVAAILQPTGADVLGGRAATGAAVRHALSEHGLFHFAGHGVFAGAGGWDSALLLAGDDRLAIGDILALPRVPQQVILASCQSGQVSAQTGIESIGLAQAFLIAGAREVVATVRPVRDRAAAGLALSLHRHLEAKSDWALAEALRRAQLEALDRGETEAAGAFRAFVP